MFKKLKTLHTLTTLNNIKRKQKPKYIYIYTICVHVCVFSLSFLKLI